MSEQLSDLINPCNYNIIIVSDKKPVGYSSDTDNHSISCRRRCQLASMGSLGLNSVR